MARKKLTDKNKFDELEFNFDQSSEDLTDDFLFDFGADTDSSGNRSPIEKVRKGASTALSGMSKTFIPGMKDRINEKMPDAGKFISDIGSFTSDMKYLSTEFQREIAPSVVQLKRAGRVVGNKIKFFLPKSLQNKYDQLMSEDDSQAKVATISKDKAEDMSISSSIDNIFSKNTAMQMQVQQAQFEDEKSDKIIDRNLSGQRHTQSFQQLQSINVATSFHQKFTENIHIPYLKKDLEIKFRHFYATRDILTQVKGLTKIIDDKLDQIRHNTALPDFVKMRMLESVKESMRDKFSSKMSGYATDGLKAVGTRINERILQPLKDMIEMAATGADIYADIEEGNAEMGGPKKGIVEDASGILGSFIGKKAAGKVSEKLFGNNTALSKLMYQWNDKFKNLIPSTQAKARAYADDNDGLLSFFASILGGDPSGPSRALNTIHLNNPDEGAGLTNQAVLSITTIMPGYLAKMTKHLETLATGKPADELIYDTKSNTFITSTLYQKQFVQEAVGDKRTRSSRLGKMSGTIKGMYSDKVINYDEIESDMLVFLNNLVMNGREIEPDYISNYTGNIIRRSSSDSLNASEWEENLDPNTSKWVQWAFKGVKDPDRLASALESIIFHKNGHKNTGAIKNINNLVMADQSFGSFQKAMQRAIQQGNASHLGDYIKRGGSTFTLDEERIAKDMLMNEDIESFDSNKNYSEKYSKEHMTKLSEAVWDDLKNDPNWNKTIVGRVLDISARAKQKWYARSDAKEFDQFYWDGEDSNELVSKSMLDKLKEVAPWAFVAIDKAQTSIKDGAKKGSAKFLAADKKRRSDLHKVDDLDPYVQRRLEMLQASGALGSIPGDMLVNMMKAPVSKTAKTSKVDSKKIFKDTVMNVKVLNFKDLAEIMKSHVSTTTTTAITPIAHQEGSNSIVGAITRFEETFKSYAKSHTTEFKDFFKSSIDYLKNLPPININTVAMTSQFDKILGAASSTAQGLWSKVGSGVKGLGEGLGKGISGFYTAAGKALTPIGKGIGDSLGGIGTGLGGLLTSTGNILSTATTFSADTMRGLGRTIRGIGGTARDLVTGRSQKRKFVDIFRKEEVDPNSPLVTAMDQINGKIIDSESQQPIKSSYGIKNALMKISAGSDVPMIVVTKEDIEHGLVDINGEDLKGGFIKKGFSLLGKGISKPFSMLGDLFKSDNPIMKAYGAMLGMGIDLTKTVGRGIKTLGKRIFGFDGLPKDAVSKQSLEEIVGKRLDTIIGLLGKGKGNDPKPGDEDGDGRRDTIFEERARDEKEEQEAEDRKKQNKFYDNFNKTHGKDGKKQSATMMDHILKFVKNPIVIMGTIAAAVTGIQKIITTVSAKLDESGGLLGFLPAIAELIGFDGAMAAAGAVATGLGYTATKAWIKRKVGGPKYPSGTIPAGTAPKKPGMISRAWQKTKALFGPKAPAPTRIINGVEMKAAPKQGWFSKMISKIRLPGSWGKVATTALSGIVTVGGAALTIGALTPSEAQAHAEQPVMDPNTGAPMSNPDTGEPLLLKDILSPEEIQYHLQEEKRKVDKTKPNFTRFNENKKTSNERSVWETAKDYGTSLGEFTGISDSWNNMKNVHKEMVEKRKNTTGFMNHLKSGFSGAFDMGQAALGMAGSVAATALIGAKGAVVAGGTIAVKATDDLLLDGALQRMTLPHIGVQTDDFLERRCKWYGVDAGVNWSIADAWKRLTGNSNYQLILELEDFTYELLKDKKEFTQYRAREWADDFGFKSSNNLDVGFWITWYKFKFVPILKELAIGLQKTGVPFEDRYKLTNAQKNVVMAHMSSACAKIMGPTTEHMNPTQSNLEAYKKKLNNRDPGKRVSYLKSLTEDTNDTLKETSSKLDPEKKTKTSLADRLKAHGTTTSTDSPVASNIGSTMTANPLFAATNPAGSNTAGGFNTSGGINLGGMNLGVTPSGMPGGSPGGMPGGVNLGNIPQAPNSPSSAGSTTGGVAIGEHMKKFESGNLGSAAVGYDVPGGTSYGSYQIISKRGKYGSTMDEFIKFCKTEAPVVYKTLYPLRDQMNTLSKRGPAVDAWQELVSKGHITKDLERKFFIKNFWKPGLANLKRGSNGQALHDFIVGDRALQEFAWSSFVALGVGGASSLFRKVFRPGMTPEQFLDSAGAIRYSGQTYASFIKHHKGGAASVARRGRNEIALLKKLIGQPPMPIDGVAPVASSSSGGITAGGVVQSSSGKKVHPMPGYKGRKSVITSPFGKKRSTGRHGGIDLDVAGNDIGNGIVPVYAYMDGKVIHVGPRGAYGNAVYIAHDDGNKSIYAHLDSISPNIKMGMKIGAGTEVGKMGTTGRSTGTHLHFEINKLRNYKQKVDPTFTMRLPGPGMDGDDKPSTGPGPLTPAGTGITPPGSKPSVPQAKPVRPKVNTDPKPPIIDGPMLPSEKPLDLVASSETGPAIGGPVTETSKESNIATISIDKDMKKFAELVIMLLQQLVASNQEIPTAFSKAFSSASGTLPKVHPNASPPPKAFEGSFTGVKAA